MARLFAALLILPALAGAAAPSGPVRGLPDCPGVPPVSTARCARAAEARLTVPFVIRASPTLLRITLENGSTREVRNATANEMETVHDAASYSAIAVSPDSRYVTLHRQFWEGEASSLLDRRTGEEIKLDGYPFFSPDGRWVATAGVDLAAEFSPNVLRIYRVTPAGLVLEHDAGAGKWGPVDASWTSPVSLQYLHGTFACYTEHGTVPTGCRQMTLRFDGARWLAQPEPVTGNRMRIP